MGSHAALIWIISLTAIFCVLLRPFKLAEAWWAGAGAAVLLAVRLISPGQAGAAVMRGLDVYLFLIGMMILSELARAEGVFDWIAGLAAARAGGSSRRLFLLIYLAGTVVTIFLSNDATAVVLTPAVLAIVRRLEIQPFPHLLACALIANAASFVLPISNPANLVVFANNMPPLGPWFRTFALPSLASIITTWLVLRFLCRERLRQPIRVEPNQIKLSLEGRMALASLVAAAVVILTASACGRDLGWPTCAAAAGAAAIIALRNKTIPGRVARGVSWSVIPLVAALFIIVQALLNTGVLDVAEKFLRSAGAAKSPFGNLLAAFTVALVSNGMNNLPAGYLARGAVQASHLGGSVNNAVLLGIDLGPNLSVTGSLATILWLIALRRENVKITAWEFLKIGAVVMPVSLLFTTLALGGP